VDCTLNALPNMYEFYKKASILNETFLTFNFYIHVKSVIAMLVLSICTLQVFDRRIISVCLWIKISGFLQSGGIHYQYVTELLFLRKLEKICLNLKLASNRCKLANNILWGFLNIHYVNVYKILVRLNIAWRQFASSCTLP
jgi:hypothetical protein